MSRNIPNERKKGGPTRGNVGHVEIDIVHIVKSRLSDREYGQLVELFDEKEDDFGARDGYILTVINQITRYGYGKLQRRKNATETAKSIRFLFPIMERRHKAPITHCYSDQGKEFLGQVKEYFQRRNIQAQTRRAGRSH